MKKVVLLLLPLIVMAVSCASVPQHAGGGSPETYEEVADALLGGIPQDDIAFADALPDGVMGVEYLDVDDSEPVIAESVEYVPVEAGFPEVAIEEPVLAESIPSELATEEPVLVEPIFSELFGEPALVEPELPELAFREFALTELLFLEFAIEDPAFAEPIPTEQVSSDTLVAEAFPEESSQTMVYAEPALPDFTQEAERELIALEPEPEPLAVASNPNTTANPNPNTGNYTNPEPVSPTVVAPQPPPSLPAASPVAAVLVQLPPLAQQEPDQLLPVLPLVEEPYPVVAPAPPVKVWEPPAFVPSIPELPNPVPDFRNLLPPPTVFSRTVYATAGQVVEVPFRGNGWIFLGETGGRRGINFDARRPDAEGQTFVFNVETAGEYALRFYRHDFVRDIIVNDHVRVVVAQTRSPSAAGAGRVIAERWPSPIDEARIFRATGRHVQLGTADTGDAAVEDSIDQTEPLSVATIAEVPAIPETPVPTAPPVQEAETPPAFLPPAPPPSPVPPAAPPVPAAPAPAAPPPPPVTPAIATVGAFLDAPPGGAVAFGYPFELLEMARSEFAAGRVAEAISLLDLFTELYPSGSDEAWWLYGQFFEADSPSRNILYALSFYHRLVREFPQSGRLADARRRIAFLERFFINIR